MDYKEYAIVIKSVCKILGAEPDSTLIRNISTYCKKLNIVYLKERYGTDEELYNSIVNSYIESITPEKELDYNTYINNSTDAKPSGTLNDVDTLTKWIGDRMPITSSKSMSVYIDTRLRNIGNYQSIDYITDFSFHLVPRESRVEIGDGGIQTRIAPSQVTYFKLGKIILPYTTAQRQRNYTNELTLTFTAMRSNGIIAKEDTYHFSFTYDVNTTNNQLVELTPVNSYCKFEPPLRVVEDISFRFNDPLYPIKFNADRLQPSSFNYISSDGRIAFNQNHMLVTGDVIVIDGLETGNDSANSAILASINDPRGIVITKINNNVISTNIDFTQIIASISNSKPWILFYSRTFRFPIEIGYQDISDL